jgi:hypothetical protein
VGSGILRSGHRRGAFIRVEISRPANVTALFDGPISLCTAVQFAL